MDGRVKVAIDNGYYLFKLGKILKDTNIDFKVIKRLMTGNLVRIDIFVLSRFCIYLKCDITDIVEYIKL